ncbi:MAG: galactokinase [Phycisphaerales bacterium]|nr:galactokinase [Phycisphaerales bacterium]
MKAVDLPTDYFLSQLVQAGLSLPAAESKLGLYESVAKSVEQRGHVGGPVEFWHVPGRIEVYGKHTDYCGGRSVLCALERGFCIAARARDDELIRLINVADGSEVMGDVSRGAAQRMGHWSNYPMTVVRRLARDFPNCRRGMDFAFCSDLPAAAGLSSSSALVTGAFLAFVFANELEGQPEYQRMLHDQPSLAAYLGAIESGRSFGNFGGDDGVGTAGGSQDHTAILCSQAECCIGAEFLTPAVTDTLPLNCDHRFVIGVSGLVAEKTGAARHLYNQTAARARLALDILNRHLPVPAATLEQAWKKLACDTPQVFGIIERESPDAATAQTLCERVLQFHTESHVIIPSALRSLKSGQLEEWASLASQSHELADKLLHNQTSQTNFLAADALRLGAVASSAFGAGFGGSVWALVNANAVPQFIAAWRKSYCAAFDEQAARSVFFESRPGPAAFRLA